MKRIPPAAADHRLSPPASSCSAPSPPRTRRPGPRRAPRTSSGPSSTRPPASWPCRTRSISPGSTGTASPRSTGPAISSPRSSWRSSANTASTKPPSIDLPAEDRTTWDAESAELWIGRARAPQDRRPQGRPRLPLLRAARRRTRRPSSSTSARATGRSSTRIRTSRARSCSSTARPRWPGGIGVQKYGAAGLIGWSSSHPEFDRDEVGWSGIRPGEKDRADVRLHGLRAAGPGPPGRAGAGPEDRRPGRRQDPGRPGLQGPDDGRA